LRGRNSEAVIHVGAKLRAASLRNFGSISERNEVSSLCQSFQTYNGTNPLHCTIAYRVSLPLGWSSLCVNVTNNPNLGPSLRMIGTKFYSLMAIMAFTGTTWLLHFCLFESSEGHLTRHISTCFKGYNRNFRQLTLQSKDVLSFETSKALSKDVVYHSRRLKCFFSKLTIVIEENNIRVFLSMTNNLEKVKGKSCCAFFVYTFLLLSKYEYLDP
jgi:hypothetical protein